MTDQINPLATHHLPPFITAPGQSDGLLVGIGLFLIVVVFLLGIAFLWLHTLPERVAHKGQKLQFEVVAILCLLALFTHNNLLWGAALILAFIDLPDLATPLTRISDSLERMVSGRSPATAGASADQPDATRTAQDSHQPVPPAGNATTEAGH